MPSSDPIARFRDIVRDVDAIAEYTAGMSEARFLADGKTADVVERCLARVSEAAVKLGMLAEQLAPNQPWADIRGLGNWLRHDYPSVSRPIVWKTVTEDLASLRSGCEIAMDRLERGA